MKIMLINVPPVKTNGDVEIATAESLKVTTDGFYEDRWEPGYVWFMMQHQGAAGNVGPFNADDLQRLSLEHWEEGDKPIPTIPELEHGMRRLLFLEVVRKCE